MGIERERFIGKVDSELMCSICVQVLQDPIQIRKCEHYFCKNCIDEWWKHKHACPVCRNRIPSVQDLIAPPRIVRNMLSRLELTCDYRMFGCTEIVRLDGLKSHLEQCEYNPKRLVVCEKGCGQAVPQDEISQHNCIEKLQCLLRNESTKVQSLTERVDRLEQKLVEQQGEMSSLKQLVTSMRPIGITSNPSYSDEVERTIQTSRWLATLKPAQVKRWGGMISTPDAVLQSIIHKGLVDSNCPAYLVDELMSNAHERHWPHGLSTLETRQINRRRYEQFVTKRVPGKQAIVIMSCENEHMDESMISSPGMVMIFAHGIE